MDPNYFQYIQAFEVAWKELGLPMTCKVHMVCEHLAEQIDFYGFGMALLNESAGEAVHSDFDHHYQGMTLSVN